MTHIVKVLLFQKTSDKAAVDEHERRLTADDAFGPRSRKNGPRPSGKGDDPKKEAYKDGKKQNPSQAETPRRKKPFRWTAKCLNTECNGVHQVVHCLNTSEEEAEKLLRAQTNISNSNVP